MWLAHVLQAIVERLSACKKLLSRLDFAVAEAALDEVLSLSRELDALLYAGSLLLATFFAINLNFMLKEAYPASFGHLSLKLTCLLG